MEHEVIDTILLFVAILLGPISLLAIILWLGVNVSISIAQWCWRMYRLRTTPCGSCFYYTGCKELACAVNPCSVLTTNARSCKDFLQVEENSKIVSKKRFKHTS